MREVISTKEISERFEKNHKDILRSISSLSNADSITALLFKEASYTTIQNKKIKQYSMNIEGFCILTDTWGFSRGESAPVKAEILSEFGHSFTVCGSERTRGEDYLYSLLKRFLRKEQIWREYGINGYFVDFYMPSYSLIIEHDGGYHFTKPQMEKDKKREQSIREYVKRELDDGITFIRIKEGKEIEGLAAIAGYIALNSYNAIPITNLFEDSEFNKVITESQPELLLEAVK